jgi:hypothetical protein
MRRAAGAVRFAAMVGVLSAPPVGAQPLEPRLVQECVEACELRLTRVAALGDETGDGFVNRPIALVHRPDGVFVTLVEQDEKRLKAYASDGSFLRIVGGAGQGPGEFAHPRHVIPFGGDTIAVWDPMLRRSTIFDAEWRVVETRRVPALAVEVFRLASGSYIANSSFQDPARRGQPLHRLTSTGEMLASFGGDPAIANPTASVSMWRLLAPVDHGTFWAGHAGRYMLQRWDSAGVELDRLEREVAWFTPHAASTFLPDRDEPPVPLMRGIHARGDTILVAIAVPDDDWRDGLGTRVDGYGRTVSSIGDFNLLYDTIVERIDVRETRIVGHHRMESFVELVTADGLLIVTELSPSDGVRLGIWEVGQPR